MPIELTPEQRTRAMKSVERAKAFLIASDYPVGSTLLDHLLGNESGVPVIEALQQFQNDDGGFGRGLEVDIKAPDSNPFATRLAMTAMLALRDDAAGCIKPSLQAWLVQSQNTDGDWHLSEATRAGELAPWFQQWQHPGLNPACCIAGLAHQLGIAPSDMLNRTGTLFTDKMSMTEIETGGFYELLPYVEYVSSGIDVVDRIALLDALSATIAIRSNEIYSDSLHFWEQVLAGGPDLIDRLPDELLQSQFENLLEEQQPDGGWPTPYDQAWRLWSTTSASMLLVQLADVTKS